MTRMPGSRAASAPAALFIRSLLPGPVEPPYAAGAVDQKAATKAQLKPYLKMVKARMANSPENVAWATLEPRTFDLTRRVLHVGERWDHAR